MRTIAIKCGGQNSVIIRVTANLDCGRDIDRVRLPLHKQNHQTRVAWTEFKLLPELLFNFIEYAL